MARPQNSPILAQLRSAKTYPEQTAALQALKNEVVGHIQKKEAWVGLGVLDPIVRTLSSTRTPTKVNSARDARLQPTGRPLSEEDRVRLQALQLIASFANGGPSFLPPLHAARALPAILTCISPSTNAPQLVVAALRAITDIAAATTLALPSSPLDVQTIADSVFSSSHHLESFCLIFSITSPKHLLQSQVTLAAGLICRLCREERHQHALATAGVLDLLASQLASFAVSTGYVIPGGEELAYNDGLSDVFPESARPGAKIGPILDAISTILGDSKYRAHRLVNSPAILAVFPSIKFEPSKALSGSKLELESTGNGDTKQQKLTAMDYILPTAHTASSRSPAASNSSFATPDRSESRTPSRNSLSKLNSSAVWDSARFQRLGRGSDNNSNDEAESPLIPWLVHLVRSLNGYERLVAASVLTALFRAGLGRKGVRETSLGLLVVPVLIDLIAKHDKDSPDSDEPADATQYFVLERAPVVLARLITDSDYLQKAAYECSAIKTLTKLLKRAYEPVAVLEQPKFWSPQTENDMDVENSSALSQLGDGGQNPLLAHRLRLRESALKGIGALASGKEDYRKALVAEDSVSYVFESLTESPKRPRQPKERSRDKPSSAEVSSSPSLASGYGTNPLSVIIAACHVVRMLSRSISVLRTALVDHAVALPVYRFMKHPDINVQIAATATICNLVVEVSPVRELLAENGIMKVLCEHAHSDDPALRLNALWALKHFVVAISPESKRACLEQLEPGWLVQLIHDDTQDSVLNSPRSRQASGDDCDEDMDSPPSDEPLRWLYGTNGTIRELDASRSSQLRQAEDRLATIREAELNPTRKARNDDIAIQEQGLDFIRNLIGPGSGATAESPCETTEMIDYVFSALGQDRLFEILASKLRIKVVNPFPGRAPMAGREKRVLHPQAKIVAAVVFILVHMAASIPRHRQLVVAQTELLRVLCQQCTNNDKEVRVAVCHLVINLTGSDDDDETQARVQRAHELQKLGFYKKLDGLRLNDRDLDVRERAKTAIYQIDQVVPKQSYQ